MIHFVETQYCKATMPACMLLLQLYPTLCNPMDCSPPGSSAQGILSARILEWIAMPSSRGSSQPRERTQVSCISCTGRRFFSTSGTWEIPAFAAAAVAKLLQSLRPSQIMAVFLPSTPWTIGPRVVILFIITSRPSFFLPP